MVSPKMEEFFIKASQDKRFLKKLNSVSSYEEANNVIQEYGYPFTFREIYEAGLELKGSKN